MADDGDLAHHLVGARPGDTRMRPMGPCSGESGGPEGPPEKHRKTMGANGVDVP